MARPGTLITDFRHLPADIDVTGHSLEAFLASIVAAASLEGPEAHIRAPLRCRKRPRRRACPGAILVDRHPRRPEIEWHCSECDFNGVITHWQGSAWDVGAPRPRTPAPAAMKRAVVEARLAKALRQLDEHDRHLLENDLSERCIASRLALHLQAEFPDHHVDVEYNRADDIAKRVPVSRGCDRRQNRESDPLAVPDLIVHRRGPTGPNVLVLELKKTTNPESRACDLERVQKFRRYLNYDFGALIECETRRGHAPKSKVTNWFGD